jgi:predicted kinase
MRYAKVKHTPTAIGAVLSGHAAPGMQKPDTRPRLIIVCGLPGSGKTTLAKALEGKLGAIRLSADEWLNALALDLWDQDRRARTEALQWMLGQRLLASGISIIIEWGTWRRAERDALRLGARALGAAVELRHLSAPADVLFERIRRRGMERPPIEREQVSGWLEAFQPPTPDEMALFDQPLTVGLEQG